LKLEVGFYATAWAGTPLEIEEFRCRRTFQRLPVTGGTTTLFLGYGQRNVGTNIDIPVALPVPLRADPTLVTSGFTWSNVSPTGNQVGFYNTTSSIWTTLSGTLTLTTLTLPSAFGMVMRFQASTSFNGVSGAVGNLYVGNQAFIALQAEP
jgi:hypothetical protein